MPALQAVLDAASAECYPVAMLRSSSRSAGKLANPKLQNSSNWSLKEAQAFDRFVRPTMHFYSMLVLQTGINTQAKRHLRDCNTVGCMHSHHAFMHQAWPFTACQQLYALSPHCSYNLYTYASSQQMQSMTHHNWHGAASLTVSWVHSQFYYKYTVTSMDSVYAIKRLRSCITIPGMALIAW
jgi:hypothetical protein